MRWLNAAVLAAVPCFAVSLAACGTTVDSSSTNATSSSTGTQMGTGGSENTGGSESTGGAAQGGGEQGGTTSTGMGGVAYPAPHPPAPQVQKTGTLVMTAQKIQPVFFQNDDAAFVAQIEDFTSKIGTSTYFPDAAGEYGVGMPTVLAPIQLTEDAPSSLSDDQIQTWLISKIEAGDGVFPAADDQTIYVLFYPSGVTISDFGGTSCQSFGGYHFNTNLHDGSNAIYAVIPRCQGGQGVTAMDLVTQATSHELLEAATDPLPETQPTYGSLDDAHFYWELVVGAEVGDLCSLSPSGYSSLSDMPYSVQRIWSNEAAAASHDPCAPSPSGEVYFNAAPELNDDVTIFGPDGSVTMKGVTIKVGETKTIDVDLFSDGPTDAWSVQAYDAQELFGGSPDLDLSLDKETGKNGDKLKLTIKPLHQAQYGLATFVLYSMKGKQMNPWVGLVHTK
ncbi:MAG TPA: hypothetical protein VHB21_18665 [Minicystis sp.]|nr:hypothetical protein [Minicystis sp.]